MNVDHAEYGRKAIEVGTPDLGQNGADEEGFTTDATDTIANVCHALYAMVGIHAVYQALESASRHFQAEIEEG